MIYSNSPAALALILLACDPAPSRDPAPSIPPPHSAPAPALSAIDADDLPTAYAYVPSGKRDPFRTLDAVEAPPPRTALERYTLDELKLIAVVSGVTSPYAMLEDPSGRGHVIRRGSAVGKESGRVVRIFENQVVVRVERLVDWAGRRTAVDIPLTIPKLPRPAASDDADG